MHNFFIIIINVVICIEVKGSALPKLRKFASSDIKTMYVYAWCV